ncbi:MAG: hypothetical protein P8X95_06305 [Anaerolineales bacterium]|jgi:hypothetical protein
MDKVTMDQVLEDIRKHLRLSRESEHEVLAEIRTHLEDAIEEARAQGEDEQSALLKAAEKFGIDEAGDELQEVHANWESVEAILATALPLVFTLILRWLTFAPDGSALDWPQLLTRPEFWIVAVAALIVPVILFRRWRLALVGWGIFWFLTVIFVVFPSVNHW